MKKWSKQSDTLDKSYNLEIKKPWICAMINYFPNDLSHTRFQYLLLYLAIEGVTQ